MWRNIIRDVKISTYTLVPSKEEQRRIAIPYFYDINDKMQIEMANLYSVCTGI